MKLATKLFALVSLVGAAILVQRRRRPRPAVCAETEPEDAMGAGEAAAIEEELFGIAEVDPEPMTQISGEGIDPDVPEPPRTR